MPKPDIETLFRRAAAIRDCATPTAQALDVLAEPHGDMAMTLHRLHDARDHHLRDSLKSCAELLRALDEHFRARAVAKAISPPPPPRPEATGAAPSVEPGDIKRELRPFENPDAVGRVPSAKLHTDGASKGNPGQAGIGALIHAVGGVFDGKRVAQLTRPLGLATNNQAEYTALVEGLAMALRMGVEDMAVFADSELMVKQVKGVYKVKNDDIAKRMVEVKALQKRFAKFSITWIPREKNTEADALSTASIAKPRKGPGGKPSHDMLGAADDNPDEGWTGDE